ncbi:MAG: VWA domain-containing protein [Desulfuromonadales bacterium]|nr:VWA domain-containing protein [Desulfuromonadales bacterium]
MTGKHPGVLLDPSATVRAALLRAALTRQPLRLELADLQRKVCRRQQQSLVIFVVDASESMATGARQRMLAARDAIFGLLTGAYQRRDQVALVAFRGEKAEVLLQPTGSIALARERLRHLAIGGATPFSDGLQRAHRLIAAAQRRQPLLVPTLIIISDGEANIPLKAGGNVMDELWQLAGQLAGMKIAAVIIDTSTVAGGSHVLRQLAQVLGGVYQRIRDLQARQLYSIVRQLD